MFRLAPNTIASLLGGSISNGASASSLSSAVTPESPEKLSMYTSALALLRAPAFHRSAIQAFKVTGAPGIKEFELIFERSSLMIIRDLLDKGALLPANETRTVPQFKKDVERRIARIDQRLGKTVTINGREISVESLTDSIVSGALVDPKGAASGGLFSKVQKAFALNSSDDRDKAKIDGGDTRSVRTWKGDDRIGYNRGSRAAYTSTSRGTSSRFGRRGISDAQSGSEVQDVVPRTVSEAAAWYRDQVKSMGGVWSDGVNQINIVGLRGRRVDGTRHTNNTVGQKVYDDTIAYIWRDASGQMQVYEFQATLDPTQLKGIQAGARLGVPQANAGQQIQYEVGDHKGRPNMGVMVGSASATRYFDRNHDGVLSPEEGTPSTAGGMNVHDKYSSAGCLVFPMDNPTYRNKVQPIVLLDPDHRFRVTILDLSIGAKPSSK